MSKKRRYKVARAKHEFLKGDNDEPNSLFEYWGVEAIWKDQEK